MPAKNGCPPKPDPQSTPDPHTEPKPLHRVRCVVVGEDRALMAELVEERIRTPPPPRAEEEKSLTCLSYEAWRNVIRAQSMARRIAESFGDDLEEARICDCFEGIDVILTKAYDQLSDLHFTLMDGER